MHWHHIVEQGVDNVSRFGAETIYNTTNVIKLNSKLHYKVSGFYSSKRAGITCSETLTIRQWLRTQSFEAQRSFGLKAINNVRRRIFMRKKIPLLFISLFVLGFYGIGFGAVFGLGTIEAHLKAMKVKYEKKGKDRLFFKTGFGDGKEYSFLCVVDAKRKYVHLAVLDVAKLKKDSPLLCSKLKTLARLNHGLLMTKAEWHEKEGEIRVSATLFGEDDISAKRFSAAITALLLAGEQVEKEMK